MSSDLRLFAYYEQNHAERDRLGRREGLIEFVRTKELLRRYLPKPPSAVIDVGGGTGIYAAWLASLGYDVHLVDIVPTHVREARQIGTFSAAVGDARALPYPDDSCDVTLLLGPLYHLLTGTERLQALCEAQRVVRPGGLIVTAYISRGAVAMDGFVKGWIDRPGVIHAVRDHVRQGASPEHSEGFGTIAYFHLPSEVRTELAAAGLDLVGFFGIEGPGWVAPDFDDRWHMEDKRQVLLESALVCEEVPDLISLSPHLLAISRRPDA
jgi:SAM-dependent methyltransferase